MRQSFDLHLFESSLNCKDIKEPFVRLEQDKLFINLLNFLIKMKQFIVVSLNLLVQLDLRLELVLEFLLYLLIMPL